MARLIWSFTRVRALLHGHVSAVSLSQSVIKIALGDAMHRLRRCGQWPPLTTDRFFWP